MSTLLKGAPVAAAINEKTKARVAHLRARGVIPTLALVRVGENDADVYYEKGAMKRCAALEIETKPVTLPVDVTEAELLSKIDELNRDSAVHGVLIFRPLPRHISDDAVRAALSPDKDVDGITDGSLAGVFTGSGRGFCPCTARYRKARLPAPSGPQRHRHRLPHQDPRPSLRDETGRHNRGRRGPFKGPDRRYGLAKSGHNRRWHQHGRERKNGWRRGFSRHRAHRLRYHPRPRRRGLRHHLPTRRPHRGGGGKAE